MKTILKTLVPAVLLALSTQLLQAQSPPHPNGGNAPGNNTPVGGGAPVGNGTVILILLSGLYGGRKWIKNWKSLEE